MRLIALLGTIFALSQTAAAQAAECKSITDPAARLTCYDKAAAAPVAPAAHSAPARPAAPARPQGAAVDSSKYINDLGDEDQTVNAKLRGICRGC